MLAASSDKTVYLWTVTDRSRPTLLGRPLLLNAQVNKVSFSPDGHTLAAAADDNTIRLWDLTDPKIPAILGSPLVHDAEAEDVAFSADGKLLATVSFDGTVRLWDLTDRSRPEPLGPALPAGGPDRRWRSAPTERCWRRPAATRRGSGSFAACVPCSLTRSQQRAAWSGAG